MAYQAPEIKEVGSVAELTEWWWINDHIPNGSVVVTWSDDS